MSDIDAISIINMSSAEVMTTTKLKRNKFLLQIGRINLYVQLQALHSHILLQHVLQNRILIQHVLKQEWPAL